MGSLFRSEDMQYVRLLLSEETAYATMKSLAEYGKFHFIDLSASKVLPSERVQNLKKRIASCLYFERKLFHFKDIFVQFGVSVPDPDEYTPAPVSFLHLGSVGDVLDALESWFEPLEQSLSTNFAFKQQQNETINELMERRFVLYFAKEKALSASSPGGITTTTLDSNVELSDIETEYGSVSESAALLKKQREKEREEKAAVASLSLSSAQIDLETADNYQQRFFSTNMSGVIDQSKQALFERMLFRVSRGNAVANFAQIPEPFVDSSTGLPTVFKSVFTILILGEQMRRRVAKIVEYFGGRLYDIPTNQGAFHRELSLLDAQIMETKTVLHRTEAILREILKGIAYTEHSMELVGLDHERRKQSPWLGWLEAIQRERMICDALKKCEMDSASSKLLICEGWVPLNSIGELQSALNRAVSASHLESAVLQLIPSQKNPPSYFITNPFTESFQSIVDTYGIPKYKEVNPGLFTTISFPFLFGVMYGDILHGTLLTLAALFLIYKERELLSQQRKRTLNEILGMAFSGRYVILMMGIFGIYGGFIYNDCASVPWNLYPSGSSYHENDHEKSNTQLVWDGRVYPFGIDPSWYHTVNELAFFNSFKMKLSVTLGVTQMIFGIILSLYNDLYYGRTVEIYLEFIPRLLFMLCTFGYMVFLILYKFTVDWSLPGARSPPNLIQTMIAMFLSPGNVEPQNELYEGQAAVQGFLLLVAFLCVPVMLLGVPYVESQKMKKAQAAKSGSSKKGKSKKRGGAKYEQVKEKDSDEEKDNDHNVDIEDEGELREREERSHDHGHGEDGAEEGHGSVSDLFITQGIHTIEFVLGAVSNTASYLRLWALSLAHAQLAAVFWDRMIMDYGIHTGSPIGIVIAFAIWFCATASVLLAMDVLECFLHALRLHWVEFQNKFYSASGYSFTPFQFHIDTFGENSAS